MTGYPLQTELQIHDATQQDFDACKISAKASNPPVEISGQFNRGLGMFRVPGDTGELRADRPPRRPDRGWTGVSYLDSLDQCGAHGGLVFNR